jgi:microcystin-dependent protein
MATSGLPNPYTYVSEQSDGAWQGQFNGLPTTSGDLLTSAPTDETDSSSGPEETSFRWATVTQLAPLRIKLDGENTVLPITPETLPDPDNLRIGTRCWVQLYGKRVIILGASGGGSDIYVPIGGIVEFAGSAVPNTNWAFCQGQSLLRTDYPALFAAIGTAFGAVDGTHFSLPDHRDRTGVGIGTSYTRGQQVGAASVTLSTANLPGHTHSFSGSGGLTGLTINSDSHSHTLSGSVGFDGGHGHSVGNQTTRSDILAGGGTNTASTGSGSTGSVGDHNHSFSGSAASDSHSHTTSGGSVSVSGTTGSTGSGSAFSNVPPSLGVNYIIRVY